jgi:hypothetical protein
MYPITMKDQIFMVGGGEKWGEYVTGEGRVCGLGIAALFGVWMRESVASIRRDGRRDE